MSESALIVAVAEAEPCVAALRARFDPSTAVGVPAHVTVLYPFRAPERIDDAVIRRIASAIATQPPFAFRLASIDRFPGVLYLAPDPAAPFIALTRALAAAFPEHPPYGGAHDGSVPHLTVAQADAAGLAAAESTLREALPPGRGIEARCETLLLIENASGRWHTRHVFPLGARARRIAPA